MKPNSIHIIIKSLFNTGDTRWITEVSIDDRTLCSYFNHFLE